MRARELGIVPGQLPTGPLNAITDVDGVRVGHVTVHTGDIHTGVTAVLPHGRNLFQDKVAGGIHVGNGYGKIAGITQVAELGTIEAPILLTNTLAVGRALDAAVAWTLEHPGNEAVQSVNAVVGETNDSWLNDIRGRHVSEAQARRAIDEAVGGPVLEGSVGAGAGTMCFGFKGGIGTSSRVTQDGHTVGVLVQTNYGGRLRIDGRLVGGRAEELDHSPDGSCMIVVATDAAVSGRALERVAARAVFAMARTGSVFSSGSGDYAVAFSTTGHGAHGDASPTTTSRLFEATLDATEEALYNSLFMATTVTGRQGHLGLAIPLDLVPRPEALDPGH